MSKTITLRATLLVVAGLALGSLAGCGGGSTPSPWAGTYSVDLDKTLAANPGAVLLGGAGKPAETEVLAALQARFAPEAYRLELMADGGFLLVVGEGEPTATLQGRWADEGTSLRLVTALAGGEAPGEGTGTTETVAIESPHLVLAQPDGSKVYLKRR